MLLCIAPILCLALKGDFSAPLLVGDCRSFERPPKIMGSHFLAPSTFSQEISRLASLPIYELNKGEPSSCVYENVSKDDIQKLFPSEVLPELQRLLTLLLQKFQREWQEDLLKDRVRTSILVCTASFIPEISCYFAEVKAMTWNMANQQDTESSDPMAVINLKLQNDAQSHPGELDVKFQLAKDTLETMLSSMHCIRDQLINTDDTSNRHSSQETNMV
ncbi:hypothetical protein CJ030_MR4G020949 [Morella rubra]|uniref:COMM domain-containing protein n=1 Tax=Morella rubra TaxID=262757 RepID=A0A6A1VWM1_9ROSI|nr:hypothetical protein CJ030_MR4G020949 [Morella rubra]